MKAQQRRLPLLAWIFIAIVLGIVLSFFAPDWFGRGAATFTGLFGNFLGFFVPVLIFALITPAIANLGQGAGKWFGATAGLAYVSTILSGLLAWAVSQSVYPWLLKGQSMVQAPDIDKGALAPYFTVEMPAPMEVMAALLLAFSVGIAMANIGAKTLQAGANELRDVVMKVIEAFVIPLLPVYIFGVFLTMGMNGNLKFVLVAFAKVLILATIMTWVVLILQYLVAGAVAGRNPFKALRNMLPAYFTALGTASSAATIPVTYKSTRKNGVSESVAGFVVPLCATVHLSGSMMKIGLFAFSVMFLTNTPLTPGAALGFIFLLGVMMVAAPGVPGGAIMAAVGLLESQLGFDESQVALMIAAYVAIDSFGTACNVTGDGAIAMMINRFAKGELGSKERATTDGAAVAQ